MDATNFFSKLDFDPVEIENLLDNILLECPELIFNLLQKANTNYTKPSPFYRKNIVYCSSSSVEPELLILKPCEVKVVQPIRVVVEENPNVCEESLHFVDIESCLQVDVTNKLPCESVYNETLSISSTQNEIKSENLQETETTKFTTTGIDAKICTPTSAISDITLIQSPVLVEVSAEVPQVEHCAFFEVPVTSSQKISKERNIFTINKTENESLSVEKESIPTNIDESISEKTEKSIPINTKELISEKADKTISEKFEEAISNVDSADTCGTTRTDLNNMMISGNSDHLKSHCDDNDLHATDSKKISTKILLKELEEELERLNTVVNGTSFAPTNYSNKKTSVDKIGQSEIFAPQMKELTTEEYVSRSLRPTKEHFPSSLTTEKRQGLTHLAMENNTRPRSAFEGSSAGRSLHNLQKFHKNENLEGQGDDFANCFNLKGTFSLGRHSLKQKAKKQIEETKLDGIDCSKKSSSYLFKDFQSWQFLQKHPIKTKHKRRQKKYNFVESSADSENYDKASLVLSNRSSPMLEELNVVLDNFLESGSDFNTKVQMMTKAWNANNNNNNITNNNSNLPSWYQLHMSKNEAMNYLMDKPRGYFVIRNSNSFKGAYGLVLKVDDDKSKKGGPNEICVRNYLIEPAPGGVKVKGGSNEPIFPNLSSLVRSHSENQFSLPCRLLVPRTDSLIESETEHDLPLNLSKDNLDSISLNCNVLYLSSEHVESLSESAALRKAINLMYSSLPQKLKKTTVCQLKVTDFGMVLTDTSRSLFFRRYYPKNVVVYAGVNTEDQRWAWTDEVTQRTNTSRIFGVVARKNGNISTENFCHLFAELDHSAEEIVACIMQLLLKFKSEAGQ